MTAIRAVPTLPEPVRRVREILDRIHPQPDVVEVGVLLAVPGRTTNVGEEHGVAPVQEVLRHGGERRTRLALRPAVHVYYHGRVLRLRLVQEGRYLATVERRITHDPRLAEGAGRDARGRGAGEAPRLAIGEVQNPHVGITLGRGEGEGQLLRVRRELEAADDALRYPRVGHPGPPAVEEQHVGVAVHVAADDEVAAISR